MSNFNFPVADPCPVSPVYQDNNLKLPDAVSSPENQIQVRHGNSGYTPVQYDANAGQDPQDFYGVLIDKDFRPSEVLCRMADALFFYMDQNCDQFRGTQRVEPVKFAWLLVALGTASSSRDIYISVAQNLPSLYDAVSIPYTLNETRTPVLDRRGHLHFCVFDIRNDPNGVHQQWNKILNVLGLRDPVTNLPFPTPLPRSAFPPTPDSYLNNAYTEWEAKKKSNLSSQISQQPPKPITALQQQTAVSGSLQPYQQVQQANQSAEAALMRSRLEAQRHQVSMNIIASMGGGYRPGWNSWY